MGRVALLLALAVTIASAHTVVNLEALKGKIVPDFRLRDLAGRERNFRQFRGKVVLLNFWSPG
ncbi:MAG: hypothetical protein OXFUSZZB_000234 [Candidatus Fervidibacter sp.]|jgi:cytochrome oxidase Cu insertion factor (SCO1/SenC/PrrC family)